MQPISYPPAVQLSQYAAYLQLMNNPLVNKRFCIAEDFSLVTDFSKRASLGQVVFRLHQVLSRAHFHVDLPVDEKALKDLKREFTVYIAGAKKEPRTPHTDIEINYLFEYLFFQLESRKKFDSFMQSTASRWKKAPERHDALLKKQPEQLTNEDIKEIDATLRLLFHQKKELVYFYKKQVLYQKLHGMYIEKLKFNIPWSITTHGYTCAALDFLLKCCPELTLEEQAIALRIQGLVRDGVMAKKISEDKVNKLLQTLQSRIVTIPQEEEAQKHHTQKKVQFYDFYIFVLRELQVLQEYLRESAKAIEYYSEYCQLIKPYIHKDATPHNRDLLIWIDTAFKLMRCEAFEDEFTKYIEEKRHEAVDTKKNTDSDYAKALLQFDFAERVEFVHPLLEGLVKQAIEGHAQEVALFEALYSLRRKASQQNAARSVLKMAEQTGLAVMTAEAFKRFGQELQPKAQAMQTSSSVEPDEEIHEFAKLSIKPVNTSNQPEVAALASPAVLEVCPPTQQHEITHPTKPQVSISYHPRVLRWWNTHDATSDPFLVDPVYVQKKYRPEIQAEIRAQHNFALTLDQFLETEGLRHENTVTFVGEMQFKTKTIKCLFTYVFDAEKRCYHRYADVKTDQFIFQQYVSQGFYELDFPRLSSQPATKKEAYICLNEDASYVQEITPFIITIADPKNEAIIRICRYKND